MFIPFQNIFNSFQTSYGVAGIKSRPDLFYLDSTIILEKKQYYIYLDMFQIITEKKVIRGNEIAFIYFRNLPCSNTVLCTTNVTASTFNVLCNLFRVCKNTWLNIGEQLLLQKDLSSVVSSCYFPFSIPTFLDLVVFDLWTWIAPIHFQQQNMINEYASTKLHLLVVCCQYFFLDKTAPFCTHLWLSNLMHGYTIDQWIFQWWALHLEFVWTLAGDTELKIWVLHHRANCRLSKLHFWWHVTEATPDRIRWKTTSFTISNVLQCFLDWKELPIFPSTEFNPQFFHLLL